MLPLPGGPKPSPGALGRHGLAAPPRPSSAARAAGVRMAPRVAAQRRLRLGDGADDDRGVVELPAEGVVLVDVEDVRDDAGDVVGAAAAQRELDQLLHGLLRALVAGERVLDRLRADDVGQPVGADADTGRRPVLP